jgi:hypothetical protein
LDIKNEYVYTVRKDLSFEQTFKAGEGYFLQFWTEFALDKIVLIDLNEKKTYADQRVYYCERSPKIILPGTSGGTSQAGETTIVFGAGIFVINCNGQYVYDEYYPPKNRVWRVNKETLQAGASTINFDVYFVDHKINMNVILVLQNFEFTWNFEADKEYTVGVYSKLLNPFETEYVIAIFDYASKTGSVDPKNHMIHSWKLAEFNKPLGKFTWFSPDTGEPIQNPAK